MRPTILAIAAALLLALVPSAAQGSSQRGAGAQIDVLRPAEGKRVAHGKLDVRLRVSTVAGFRATVAGRDVSRRFQRQGKVLRAQLRIGRDFRLGENHLLVAVGRGHARRATTVAFVARRQARPLLSLSTSRTRSARTPLRVRLRLSHPVARLGLRLNDRRIRLGATGNRRTWVVALGADDGLRFGANTVTATAERTDAGHFDRERRNFRLDRSAPLVGAGPDRVTRGGNAVVLDGRSTRSADGRALAFRWQLVEKPPRSKARIANSTAKVARLLPDLPGSYRARLVAAPVSAATRAAEASASASASSAASEPTCLRPAGAASGRGAGPLSSPLCVTPFGDPTTPPLPLEAQGAAAADVVGVSALATQAPMGWPIETIAADGSVRVGPHSIPRGEGWARLVVLGQQSLLPEKGPWGSGEQTFSLGQAKQFAEAVEKTTTRQIVVISGMARPQSQAPKTAREALAKAVSALGAQAPASAELEAAVKSGNWSALGTRGEPGRTATNLFGLTQQTPAGTGPPSLAGSINGYLQNVLVDAFSFVSPEFVPIDTRAKGSSNTVSVFQVGAETVTSGTIGNGTLGLHIAAFETDAPGGAPKLAGNGTFVIDDPYSNTDMAGVKAAAAALESWRESPQELLVVLQTFGEGAVGPNTAPWASPDWVNDALIHPGDRGLHEWKGQPYLAVKHESELEQRLDRFWNPGYPTVAGEVGNLTGPVGHDLVANLGAGNPEVEVTRLSMVANNRPANPSLNYVRGFAGPAEGRLVGTLIGNSEGGWSVQAGVPSPAFSPEEIWQTAYAAPTPWPLSESREDKAAMAAIAARLFGASATDVREEYVLRRSAPWPSVRERLQALRYEATSAYTATTFGALQGQLSREIGNVIAVKEAIGEWQKIFTDSSFSGFVRMNELSSKIVDNAIQDAKLRETKEAGVSPEAIISESLYTAADLIGFPEATEEIKLAETIGVLAGAFGLAEAATPEAADEAEGPDTAMIRDRASRLGGDLVRHFETTSDTLTHLEEIFFSDWGKLQTAAADASGSWAFGGEAEKLIRQSLAVTTSQQLYEGLLPLTYEQWVISPYVTVSNGSGPQPPGRGYGCLQYNPAYESESTKRPFASEPDGGLSTAIYRPWNAPGASTPPALPYTTPYTIRALKSSADELKMRELEYAENRKAVTVSHDGSSPPKSLVNPLFEPVNPGESNPDFPVSLGTNKVAFYAGFGAGPTDWRRLICAQE